MAALLRQFLKGYHIFNEEWSDDRTKDLWLMSSPLPVLFIMFSYVYFVRVLGPKLMADRKPFQLDWIIQIFDLVQIIANLYIFERCLSLGWGGIYSWRCEPIDYSHTPHAIMVTRLVYYYFLIKVVDLLDTVFIVLRKKNNQASFLHVYHHTGMVLASWLAVKYYAGGHGTFVGFINSFVHAVMYTYYFLTALNPEYKKYIWLKKQITKLQMFQFFAIIIHGSQLFISNPCNYPLLPHTLFVPQNFFMLVLFSDFYRKAYLQPKKNKSLKKDPSPKEE